MELIYIKIVNIPKLQRRRKNEKEKRDTRKNTINKETYGR